MAFQTVSYLKLSVAELHRRLEQSTVEHDRSEKLISFYLVEMNQRKGYQDFGYANIYDYALGKFGFAPRRTRYYLSVGKRVGALPNLTEAVLREDVSFSKAAEISRVATPENEKEWIEKTRDKSVREVIGMIQDGVKPRGGNVNIWMSAEQSTIFHRALEVCRMASGEPMQVGRCLELICGEFLATYEYEMMKQVEREAEDAEPSPVAATGLEAEDCRDSRSEENEEAAAYESTESKTLQAEKDKAEPVDTERLEAVLCPEDDVLPAALPMSPTKTHLEVLRRDFFRCQVPGCSVRCGLHVHHIRRRSRFGKKTRSEMNDLSNQLVLCVFHHRQIHAGLFGLEGRAPDKLEWRWPEVEETAAERIEKAGAFDGYDPDDFETEETAAEASNDPGWFVWAAGAPGMA